MSYKLSAQVIGGEELSRAFAQARSVTERELTNAIKKTAVKIEFTAKAKAPHQYGNLRGSINTKGPTATGNNVVASVGTNLDYARYQEEGTGIYGPRKQPIRPKNAKLLAWKRGGQWFFAREVKGVRPKRYFKQAREDAKPQFVEEMREAVRRITHHLATA